MAQKRSLKLCVHQLINADRHKPASQLFDLKLLGIHVRFDILGSTLASNGHASSNTISSGVPSLLQDAEGNHCSSFPTALLRLIQTGAQLSCSDHPSSLPYSSTGSKQQQQALLLLSTAQSFDPLAWATDLQPRSPATDLLHRTHIASAHRAAVCIYLSRVLLSLCPTTQLSHDLDSLVADIITHLSFIRSCDALFAATTWPALIAGAETNNRERQTWVARRFQELWEVEPWGLIRGALRVLERIWAGRRSEIIVNGEAIPLKRNVRDGDRIGDLRRTGVDWLIV